MQGLRVVELAERTLVLAGQSGRRGRKLVDEPPQFSAGCLIDLGPLIGDLDQRTSQVLVEDIFLPCAHLVAAT